MAKRPRDPVQLAKQVFDIATGAAEDTVSESKRHPSLKRKGGLMVAIHAMYYNFGRIHKTLRITPAMAAGLGSRLVA